MADTRYRRGKNYSADMAAFARMMSMDNASQLELLQARLGQALREEVTDRQRQMLFLYYAQGLNMREIAQALGVERSTVSRTMSWKAGVRSREPNTVPWSPPLFSCGCSWARICLIRLGS